MGITDLDPNAPNPNAPTVAWGSPQANTLARQQTANYNADPTGINSVMGGVAAKQAAQDAGRPDAFRATPTVNFASGADGGGGGGGGGAAYSPLRFAPSTYGTRTIAAHDTQNASDTTTALSHQASAEALSGADTLNRAQVEENEARAQAHVGRAGQIEGEDLRQKKEDATTDEKIDAARKKLDPSLPENQIDPNHYQSQMSVGNRMRLMIAAGLMQGGMALRGQGGPNPILEQIQHETNRDIDAQKNKQTQKYSMYHQLLESGLDEKKAHAATTKAHLEAGLESLDAAVSDSHSQVVAANAQPARAEILAKAAAAESQLTGRAQAQTVGTGTAGWTEKDANAAYDKWAASDGQKPLEYFMKQRADARQIATTGGPGGDMGDWAKKAGNAGAGRQAGVVLKYQQQLTSIDSVLDQIKKAKGMLTNGYSYGSGKQSDQLLDDLAKESSKIMGGGEATEGAIHGARSGLPSTLNQSSVGQWFNGHEGSKSLDLLEEQMRLKQAQLKKIGPHIQSGAGFAAPEEESAGDKSAGATEW